MQMRCLLYWSHHPEIRYTNKPGYFFMKNFAEEFFVLSFMKIDSFLTNIECLPIGKLRHTHIPGYGPDWRAEIVVNHGPDLTNKFISSFLIWTIKVRISCCHTFVIVKGLIQLLSNSLHSVFSVTLKRRMWISTWFCFIYIYCPIESSFVCIADKTGDKEKHRRVIYNLKRLKLPITSFLSIFRYTYKRWKRDETYRNVFEAVYFYRSQLILCLRGCFYKVYIYEWWDLGLAFKSTRFRSQIRESSLSSRTEEFW